ncbi:fructokinase-2 [Tanacetum coccineum]
MEAAKEAGAVLSYDPKLNLPLWPSSEEARKKIMNIWDKPEIDDETAMPLWHPNLKLLLVTLGDKGCNHYTKE